MLAAITFAWGIIKIIGLVLLVILGLLFLLLALILLAPVRYQVSGSYYGTPKGVAKVTWLFPVMAAKAVYEEKLTLAVRVLGFRVFGMEKVFGQSQESKPEDELSQKQGDAEEKESRKSQKTPEEKEVLEEEEFSVSEERVEEKESPETKESLDGKEFSEKKEPRKKKKKRKRKRKKRRGFSIRKFSDRLKEKKERIKRKLQSLKKKKKKIWKFLCDEKNHDTFRLLVRQLKRLLRHVLPQKAAGKARFGFDDPATTGQVLTYLSLFYGFYGDQVEWIPVFEESVMEGEGRIKGRVRVGTVLMIAARMLFDKNFRILLKKCLKA